MKHLVPHGIAAALALAAAAGLLAVRGAMGRDATAVPDGQRFVAASDPALRYGGRWDLSNPDHPRASWPGFSVATRFEGRSISVRMTDPGNWFNVEVDGKPITAVGGIDGSHTLYQLASGLSDGPHEIRLQRRNISFDAPTEIEGFIVDHEARLTAPENRHRLRIEFIGDSYTAAEGNEATRATLPWHEKFAVTNFANGYASMLGRALDAEVTAVCRSGSGALCAWNGERRHPMGERLGWSLIESPVPAWTRDPAEDLVIISLGINDYNGLKRGDGSVAEADSAAFRTAYRDLLRKVRSIQPAAKIVALAPFVPWARENIAEVVRSEMAGGGHDLFYAAFDRFGDGYVADGHPTVETHRKMAAQILDQFVRLGIAPAGSAIAADLPES